MQRVYLVAVLLALILCASSAQSIEIWSATPRARVARPSETQVIVYDSRPELGIGMHSIDKRSSEMISKLGIRLVRTTLYWNKMEPTDKPGVYDSKYSAEWDALVDHCRKSGVYLEVVVHGDPPGVSYSGRKAGYERFAGFVADMARRYPSIIYWELFNEMDSGFTCLFGASDNIPMRERGRNYAEMLKIAHPIIKAANPACWILCGGMNDTDEFPRGVYEGGGKPFFDIMNIHTYGVPVLTSFVERGKRVRQIMADNGDADKPLWNTEFGLDAGNVVGAWGYPHSWSPAQDDAKAFDAKQLEDYEGCLRMNGELDLYQKMLPYQFQAGNERDDDASIKTKVQLPTGMTIDDFGFGIVRSDLTPRPTYTWLQENQINAPITKKPRFTTTISVPTTKRMIPVGYEYREIEGGIEIKGVVVDSLVPTRIDLIFAPESETPKPGVKPSEKPRKPGAWKPAADPWDI